MNDLNIDIPALISNKTILDACCGGKMFWIDKTNAKVLFQDQRLLKQTSVGKGKNARLFSVEPDIVGDYRNMPYPDNHFRLVVFDPSHFTSLGENSYMAIKYGRLDKKTFKEDLRKGFSECFRVLQAGGILVFKWNEYDIPLRVILELTPNVPLFGHPSGKTQKTHWVLFMK